MKRFFLGTGALLALAAFAAGCDQQPSYAPPQPQMVPNAPIVQQQNFLMRAEAFNLGQIVSLLKTNQVTDAASLEKIVNDPSSGINNVDIDNNGQGDGKIDLVTVSEQQSPTGKQFEFQAYPSSQGGQNPVTIATIDITMQNNMVNVQGGYPQYVNGYDQYYYHDNFAVVRDMLFISWLMSPRPMYYPRPYMSYGWGLHPVYAPSVMRSMRTSYSTQTRVSPIPTTARPANYQPPAPTRVPTGLAQRPAPSPSNTNLSARGGMLRDFTVMDRSKSVPMATGFGAKPSAPAPSSGPSFRPSAPSSSGFRSSSPSFRSSSPSFSGFRSSGRGR